MIAGRQIWKRIDGFIGPVASITTILIAIWGFRDRLQLVLRSLYMLFAMTVPIPIWILLLSLGTVAAIVFGIYQRSKHRNFKCQGLTIVAAKYGFGDQWLDVTCTLDKQISENKIIGWVVSNENMGNDPFENQEKFIQVVYSYRGEWHLIKKAENDMLNLPETSD